jgi:D-alanine-D-alanine ligase-like ATP-grasp enzyme
MFDFLRSNNETNYSKNKKIREIQQHYEALNQINNERVKQMSNYAKSLEHVLKRYNAVEQEFDVDLNQQPHEDKDYSDMLGELAQEYVGKKYSSKVGNVVKDVIKSNKAEINNLIGMFINQQVEGFMKNQGNKPAEKEFQEVNK